MATRFLSEKLGVAAILDRSPEVAGVIQAFSGNSIPSGWLACDGSEYSQTTYPELFSRIGTTYATQINTATSAAFASPIAGNFRVPDYRGVFLRGAGTYGSVTTNLGALQADAMQSHTHPNANGFKKTSTSITISGAIGSDLSVVGSTNGANTLDMGSGDGRMATETRPVNKGITYIIRTWDAQSTLVTSSVSSGGLTPTAISTTSALLKGKYYLANTSAGSFTVTLPTGSTDAYIRIADALETWDTYPLTIAPANGEQITTFAINDLVLCNVKGGWIDLAWNGSRWVLSTNSSGITPQATATTYGTVTAGMMPGSVSGALIGSGYVGEQISNTTTPEVNTGTSTTLTLNSLVLPIGIWRVDFYVWAVEGTGVSAGAFWIANAKYNNSTFTSFTGTGSDNSGVLSQMYPSGGAVRGGGASSIPLLVASDGIKAITLRATVNISSGIIALSGKIVGTRAV